jgi:putative tryptophan/tyrosine transport system substrate-binding protein
MKTAPILLLALMAALSTGGIAPAADQPHRVGILTVSGAPGFGDGIAKNLELKGYVLDRGLVIVTRSADGKLDRLPTLAKELVAGAPEAIVTLGYPAAVAARKATTTIPLVVASAGDPVATGFAGSLNRPGGDITGVSDVASELSAKRLQLLKAAVPGLKRVAMLYNADDLGMTLRYKAAEAAAKGLGIAVQPLGVREPDDFDTAFAAMMRDRPDGIMMVTDVLTILNRKRVFEFAAAQHLPAIFEADNFVHDGGLMSYGPDGKERLARLADLVDRILKGTKPADLPFELPTRFILAINLKTAGAIGLAVPQLLLTEADEVIE